MKIKVIAIVHFAPKAKGNEPEAIDLGNGEFTQFYDSFQLWYYALGYNLMKRYPNDLEFEIWQPDDKISETLIKNSDNGVVYKLLPGKFIKTYTLSGIKKRIFSKEIIDSLEYEIKTNERVLLFFRGTNEYILNKIVNRYNQRVPFVAMFSIQISNLLVINHFFRYPIKMVYFYFHSLIPYKRFLTKVKNIIPSTQHDIRANPFFEKLNVFYRDSYSGWGIDIDFWSRKNKPNKETIKAKLGIKEGEKVLLISSRIVQEKQVKEMILALGNFKEENFRLIITGRVDDSPYSTEVNELIIKLLPGKVLFSGYITDEDLREIYSITDLMLSFSISEGGPFSIFQAYLMEVPVIQSSVGIASEMALQYKISRLVDPKSIDELSMALDDFFNGNIPKILERKIAANYFNWNTVADYYYTVFNKVMSDFIKVKIY